MLQMWTIPDRAGSNRSQIQYTMLLLKTHARLKTLRLMRPVVAKYLVSFSHGALDAVFVGDGQP